MKDRKKILLLNPPAEKSYLRDYYCSTLSKGGYYWHPIDLLAQSALLQPFYELAVIDAIVEKLSREDCEERINNFAPEVILFLSSTQSFDEDRKFLAQLKESLPGRLFFGSGEVFLENPDELLKENGWLEGALLSFIDNDLYYYLEGEREKISNMAYRLEQEIVIKKCRDKGEFDFPTPAHELFPLKHYHMPNLRRHPFATVLTNFGCPYRCYFCNSGSLGFRQRKIKSVIAELRHLNELGIKQIFMKDMTFGGNKKATTALLKRMAEERFSFSWNCYSRVEILSEEIVPLMKKAGCHLVQIGIETLDFDLRKRYGKGFTQEQMERAFSHLKKNGIDYGLHFIIGLPGESREGIHQTIAFAKKSGCKYASFNVAYPRKGSLYGEHFEGEQREVEYAMEQLSQEEREELTRLAYKKFYLNPLFLWNQLINTKTLYEFNSLMINGLGILKKQIFKEPLKNS